ncbi:PTS lactose/cellobiose transporter subunit IIA [Caviibacter abscessus]|uniref:PTS lactose/cellobiose transporter subunit IIA n=1 Tax=Caviibacter abscessus TaxID=1766719 RepID=UPI0008366AC3|nr:PTS lactose/cellobiose transporter subunit IIA [Caviibacter abscessus]
MSEEMEEVCFSLISTVGMAKSLFIEAINDARKGEYELAKEKIEEGEQIFSKGHDIHLNLVQKEAQGKNVEVSLLLIHAQDQLMNAETFKILAYEFIELYKKVNENNEK